MATTIYRCKMCHFETMDEAEIDQHILEPHFGVDIEESDARQEQGGCA
jgi:hypothetical protein